MARRKIDWPKLWEKFEDWIEKQEKCSECKTCGHKPFTTPEWPDQQAKIQRLVNAQLRGQK